MKVIAGAKPIKMWTDHVPVEGEAIEQLKKIASLPFIYKHLAVMPDCHVGKGSTVGTVIATHKAIIPAAVGVDLGCGMMAVRTNIKASQLPDNLFSIRTALEKAIPHGRTNNGGPGDRGAWGTVPDRVARVFCDNLMLGLVELGHDIPQLERAGQKAAYHLGTLGGGNHFVEICIEDESQDVWVMLHSGSRGIGNAIGTHYINLAKADMATWHINIPDSDLAYIPEGTQHFDAYVKAVGWAQAYAAYNREIMMDAAIRALTETLGIRVIYGAIAVNCHHNYVEKENHFGQNVWITRKGAVRARVGDLGIIPGSMGAKSFIVRGLGNKESFCSCSHGAGRVMSRTAAKKLVSLEQHIKDTAAVECRKDADVVDETPRAYKNIDDVMRSQEDLVEIVHTLRQVVCVKG